jgi:hypothetical protein
LQAWDLAVPVRILGRISKACGAFCADGHLLSETLVELLLMNAREDVERGVSTIRADFWQAAIIITTT